MTTVAEEYLLDEEMRKRGARSIPREEQQADQKATLQKCLQIVKRAKKKLSGKTEVAMTTATERRSKDRLPTSLVEWAKKGFAKIRPKVNSAAQNLLPPPSLIRRTYPEADPYHPRCMVCDTYALHTISLHYDKLVCNSCRKFYRTLFTDIGFERCRTMGELSCDCGVRTCRVCHEEMCRGIRESRLIPATATEVKQVQPSAQ
ncbi:PREDICTED: uncharacterized protein LOC106809515 [Priapulus caudatus]|uniref:Uncharacterized protein LOC106809515 n=1 Tax=Priapulus caudatus TaxID=37621 RepID=A0ABM1E7C4_PRICU|nr:PREDICTED: uncharacterized protein LOC106809515 [Priapulus caudatus]